jgi:hypothetical protein
MRKRTGSGEMRGKARAKNRPESIMMMKNEEEGGKFS